MESGSTQANLDPVLNYLAGCKYLEPPGRWELWLKDISSFGDGDSLVLLFINVFWLRLGV